jgi:hypothetical protein
MSKQGQKLLVFVVMPFADEFRDAYELGIKPACVEAGGDCGRVDEQLFLENILERIYGEIEKADVIIAEMTSRNPNVFYEVGYAHGLGKPVILLTRSSQDIPFDLMHYPHVVYGGQIRTLKAELEKKVRWCIEHPERLKSQKSFRSSAGSALDQMGEQITSYLTANRYTRISFERLTTLMGFPEEQVRNLIQKWPSKFRFALIRGNKPGIGLVKRS